MAELVGKHMVEHGMKINRGVAPHKMEKKGEKINVYYKNKEGKEVIEEYDTVLLAIGRKPDTESLHLEKVKIEVNKNGKIKVNEEDETSNENIMAIGDVVEGRPELTPVAIKLGVYLARRLGGKGDYHVNLDLIPTTVFTPLEYGFVGLSEEDAIKKYGKEKLDVYHNGFKPLEWNMYEGHEKDNCYSKVIVKKEDRKVVGFHICCPHAGEVT